MTLRTKLRAYSWQLLDKKSKSNPVKLFTRVENCMTLKILRIMHKQEPNFSKYDKLLQAGPTTNSINP